MKASILDPRFTSSQEYKTSLIITQDLDKNLLDGAEKSNSSSDDMDFSDWYYWNKG